jgi:hypothetical protein
LRAAFVMRPFDLELLLSQRYWQKSYVYGTAPGTALTQDGDANSIEETHATGFARLVVAYIALMRATPAVTLYDNPGASGKISYYDGSWHNGYSASVFTFPSDRSFVMSHSAASSQITQFAYTLNARL